MMALSGVRISWLTLARNSDFCALAFGLLERGDVAQDGAELPLRPLADAADGHEQRNDAALPHPAEDLATVVEEARHAVGPQALEVIERGAVALGGEEDDEALARDLVLIVAEQRLGGTVERQDAAGVVEDDDAVGRGIEDRGKLAQPALAGPQVELERAQPLALLGRRRPGDDHEARRQPIPLHRRQPDIDRDAFVAAAGERERRHALKSRRRPHSAAKQERHAALRRELPDVVVIDEIEENAVDEERLVAAMDENADRRRSR